MVYNNMTSRYDELNERISSRFVPDEVHRPNLEPTPISTKYMRGSCDLVKPNPISKFAQSIDLETEFRGQDRAKYRTFVPNITNTTSYSANYPSVSSTDFHISTSRKITDEFRNK